MLTITQYERNIMETLGYAGDVETREGKEWYQDAHDFAQKIVSETGLTLVTVVGVIAVLSPRCSWEINKQAAEVACKFGCDALTGILKASVKKARMILEDGLHPIEALNNAPKTTAFYHNILSAGQDDNVTIDAWAIRAAYNDPNRDGAFPRKEYCRVELAYQNVARYKGLTPPQLQAIVWTVIRSGRLQRRLF